MGNCCTTTPGAEINIQQDIMHVGARLNRKAMAEAEFSSDPQHDVDLEQFQRNLVQETAGRLQDFIRGIQLSHPEFYSQVVFDIWSANDFTISNIPIEGSLNLADLVYRPAQTLHDGRLYEGTWNEQTDNIEGLGVLVASDGSIIEGFFSEGRVNGKGRRITHANKEQYTGDWKEDMRHGAGEVSTSDGNQYSGSWLNDLKHGSGVERWNDGACYNGEFCNGLKQGQGTFKWVDGSSYSGTFLENMIHGQGTYKWSDGRIFIGGWKENKMHGEGKFTWDDGRIYEGEYIDDKKHGKGKFSWPDGRIYDGLWADGRQHGIGQYTSADGRTRQGEWVDGKRIQWFGTANEVSRHSTIKDGGALIAGER